MLVLKSKSKYYYMQLDALSQRAYNSILSAWEARNRQPSFISNLIANVNIKKVLEFIAWDNPGLFYVDFSRILISCTSLKTTVHSEFHFSDRQITDAETQIQQEIDAIISKIPFSTLDKYEKELALHDFLTESISYDYRGANNTSASIVGGLLAKKAVCEGYAKTFKMLCDHVGLSSLVVAGTATPQNKPSERHAWNIVKLSGVCAHVDVTWDSTMRTNGESCHDHFNITDDDIAQDHDWDKNLLPPCTSTVNNWFCRNGNVVADDTEFKNFIIARLQAGQKSFSVKLCKKHRDQSQVMKLVGDALTQSSRLGRVSSYSVRYTPMRGVASIAFT